MSRKASTLVLAALAAVALVLGITSSAYASGGTVTCVQAGNGHGIVVCGSTDNSPPQPNALVYTNPDPSFGTFAWNPTNYSTHWTDRGWVYTCNAYGHTWSGTPDWNVMYFFCVATGPNYQYRDAFFEHPVGVGQYSSAWATTDYNDIAVQHPGTQTASQACDIAASNGDAPFAAGDNKHAYTCFGPAYNTGTTATNVQMVTYDTESWIDNIPGPGDLASHGTDTVVGTTYSYGVDPAFKSPVATTHA